MTAALSLVLALLAQNASVQAAPAKWVHLSSKTGDLPVPGTSTQQTACLVFDIDRDGINDFVIGSRVEGSRLVWYRRRPHGWTVYPIDKGLNIEAGGDCADIDGDGDLDLVLGDDWSGQKLYWWENPAPRFDPPRPWVRREVKSAVGTLHHDQLFGDFDGDGRLELVYWVRRFDGLFWAPIPRDPKRSGPWPAVSLLRLDASEGLAKADIDGDGKLDLVAAGRWFKHVKGRGFETHLIDDDFRSARTAAGQLVEGGAPEVVFVNGDSVGLLKWFERDRGEWTGHELLPQYVLHGHSLQVVDVDQDGHLDIFCAEMAKWTDLANAPDHPNARMWIFYGDGRGHFTNTLIASGVDNHESRVADLDGDGDLDILVKPYNLDTPRLDVWLNRGTGPVAASSRGPK